MMLKMREACRLLYGENGPRKPQLYNLVKKGVIPSQKDAYGLLWVDSADLLRYKLRRRDRASVNTPEMRMAEAVERIQERLERIEAVLLSNRLEEPRPQPPANPASPWAKYGLNTVEEKSV